MLQSTGPQRVGPAIATEQQQHAYENCYNVFLKTYLSAQIPSSVIQLWFLFQEKSATLSITSS